MKSSSWNPIAISVAILCGVAFLAVALWQPGRPQPLEASGATPGSSERSAQQKSESLRRQQEQLPAIFGEGWGLAGSEGEHRVFVSATLVYLPDNPEPVQALDRSMKTGDGLEIGWKMKYGFNPADPRIRDEDPDGDGFTNGEEYEASPQTDPLNREDSPPKERKLRVKSAEPLPMAVSCPEKSGGFFTLRFQAGKKRQEFRGRPGEAFWLLASPDFLEVFANEKEWRAAREKAQAAGQGGHGIPLKFVSYRERIEKIKDASTGGVEIEVDNSEIVLERGDALAGRHTLLFSGALRSRPLTWDVGNILLSSPGLAEGALGPLRLGESFSYEGKEFAVVAREGSRIQLKELNQPDAKPFWVPPESPGPVAVP